MKSINILTGLALLCLAGNAMAQNENDALRYSRLGIGGTARVQGIGGSQVALGADAGNLAGNPAGLGLFRRSEFTFTPGFTLNNTSSQVGNSISVDQRNNLNLSGFGLVFANRKSDGTEGDWRGGAFGVGFTRQNNFQNKFNYNRQTGEEEFTILESIEDSANEYGIGETNFENLEGLAFETYLLNQDAQGRFTAIRRNGRIQQAEDVLNTGAQNQWDFSYGASYRDKVYLGGAIGFSTLRYHQERVYRETENDATTDFTSLNLRDEFTTTGNGINARIGVIYRPTDMVRVGASIQSPTFYSMNEQYITRLQTTVGNQNHDASTDPGEYQFNLTTPFRANGGLAVILGKYGFVSGDVEYVDYSRARLNDQTNSDAFSGANNNISTLYSNAVNVKIGAEGRFDVFRVRAGFAHYGDPYATSTFDRKQTFITAGAGIKQANYFVDVALVNGKYNSVYSPYTFMDNTPSPVVNTTNRNNNVVFTVGMSF